MHATVSLGKQGRLVIPADIRQELGLQAGDDLSLYVSGRALVIEMRGDAVDELRRLTQDVPRTRSLVDELLAERRREAASE